MSYFKQIIRDMSISSNSCRDEVQCQVILSNSGLSPSILGSEAGYDTSFVEMEHVEGASLLDIVDWAAMFNKEIRDQLKEGVAFMLRNDIAKIFSKITGWAPNLDNILIRNDRKIFFVGFRGCKDYATSAQTLNTEVALSSIRSAIDARFDLYSGITSGEPTIDMSFYVNLFINLKAFPFESKFPDHEKLEEMDEKTKSLMRFCPYEPSKWTSEEAAAASEELNENDTHQVDPANIIYNADGTEGQVNNFNDREVVEDNINNTLSQIGDFSDLPELEEIKVNSKIEI